MTTLSKSRIATGCSYLARHLMPVRATSRANRDIDARIRDEQSPYNDYPLWVLQKRLRQEHDRAQSIEGKTDRLGQRILGVVAFIGLLMTLSPSIKWTEVEAVVGAISLWKILRAWWLTIKANRTTTMFGKGTEFEFKAMRNQLIMSKAVFCQELANTKMHNFNVAAVACLRNGLVLGVVTVGILIVRWFIAR